MPETRTIKDVSFELDYPFKNIRCRLMELHDISSALKRIGCYKYKDTEIIALQLIQIRSELSRQISKYISDMCEIYVKFLGEFAKEEAFFQPDVISPFAFENLTDNSILEILYCALERYLYFKKKCEEL